VCKVTRTLYTVNHKAKVIVKNKMSRFYGILKVLSVPCCSVLASAEITNRSFSDCSSGHSSVEQALELYES